MNDKEYIIKNLLRLFHHIPECEDILSMKYREVEHGEYIIIEYTNLSVVEVNVTGDSNLMMIKDIIQHIM